MADEGEALRERLERYVGEPLGSGGPAVAPDPVNVPMIRHWVDALDDRNPVYLDAAIAAKSRFGGVVAPPAMLQTWTMARPRIEGIAERGGAPTEVDARTPLVALDREGYLGTLATNSDLEFVRYLRPGERLQASAIVESISERKATSLGLGYFVTWQTRYLDEAGEVVGRQVFRILKFRPGSSARPKASESVRPKKAAPVAPAGEALPAFELAVTPTVIVAGAIASRDFMPVHHDAGYARSQGAPDLFMNILTTNGYVSRYVTDWAGPEARLRSIATRLGAPAVPGKTLRFTGQVVRRVEQRDERLLEVAVRAANDLGSHATATVLLTLRDGDVR